MPDKTFFEGYITAICHWFFIKKSKHVKCVIFSYIFAQNFSKGDIMFVGELISLGVAISWTATALFAEVGSKRMGSLPFNTIRMTMSLAFLVITLWLVMGVPYPRYADGGTWTWLLLSGVVGYVIGVSASLLATQFTSAGIAQTLFALTPILIIAPAAVLFHQKVTAREVIGAVVSVAGVCLFFV